MMKEIIIVIVISLTGYLLTGCEVQAKKTSCPEIEGSYQIENSAMLYIHRQPTGEYIAMAGDEADSTEFLPVTLFAKEKSADDNIPECSVILKGAGILMPSDKDKTYNVTSQSQNYTSDRKPGTPLVLMMMAGFQTDVYGVTKTSDALPKEILNKFNKGS